LVMEYLQCESKGYCYKTYTFCWEEKNGRIMLQKKQTDGALFSNAGCQSLTINNGICLECVPNCDEKE